MNEETTWLPATTDFMKADVVRWTEAIWSEKKRGRGKKARNVLIGKQQVTGQVTEIDKDFVHIKVIASEIIEKDGCKDSRLHKTDGIIRKKPKTLVNGKLERLLWSDEDSRSIIKAENNEK